MPAHLLDRRVRGFSLIEMMIALGISTVVIAGALALLMAQQRGFQATSADRAMQETARVALEHITTNLRQAGFGVDPAVAFDFGPATAVRIDRAPSTATIATAEFPAGGCGQPVSCRDSITGPDEIVFLARDPSYGPHPLVSPAAKTLSFYQRGTSSTRLKQGQILQVMCYTGAMTWAYVRATAAQSYPPINSIATINVTGTSNWNFPTQDAFSDTCFQTVGLVGANDPDPTTLSQATKVFKVDRYRYYIQTFSGRPYLMLDQGLTDPTTSAPITEVVAPDVEDIQFAYVFPNAPANQVVGAGNTRLTNDENGINLAPTSGSPVYSDPPSAPTRLNHHPGNIRAVRVYLVVRSAEPDAGALGTALIPAAGNRPAIPGTPGYRRMVFQTTVAVRNLDSRAPYYPTYQTSVTDAAELVFNVGGG